jgi:hypothetical protein
MAKRKSKPPPPPSVVPAASGAPRAATPPVKRPRLLAVSILLFALWFLFLLVAAIRQSFETGMVP